MKHPSLALVTLAALSVTLAGCVTTPEEPAPEGSSAAASVKIGISLPAVDEYYGVVRDGAVAEAEARGLTLIEGNGDGAGDPTQQIAKIEAMLAQDIDVLAVAPPGETFIPVLDRARDLGVKVVFIDQQVASWPHAATFIATDNPAGSQLLGEYLVKRLDGQGHVGIMIGIPGIPLLLDRYSNFKTELEKAGIKVTLSSESDGCQLDTAVSVARNFVVANPDLDAVYSTCGPTGVAVDQVLAERGGETLSVSWDVLVQQINNILEGREEAAVAQFPQQLGRNAVDYAVRAAAGEQLPKYVDNGTEIVTKDNAGQFFHEGSTGYSYKVG